MSDKLLVALCVILLNVSGPILVNGDIDIITRLCRFEGCYDLDIDNDTYSGLEYNKKLIKLFSGGIPQLMYEDVPNLVKNTANTVSPECRENIVRISKNIKDGMDWAFRVIDSSGKTPTAFLEGTVTSLGDYDECLAISSPGADIKGKYCLVDIFPMGYKNRERRKDGKVSLNSMQYFKASAYYFGLCFPSSCSENDVRVVVSEVVKPFPLMVKGDLNCDTLEDRSFYHLLTNLRLGPFISLVFLTVVLTTVAISTVRDVLTPDKATPLNKSFSLVANLHKLFWVPNSSSGRQDIIDWFKMLGITFGVFAHIMCCLESPIGFFLLSHHSNLEKIISNPVTMPLFNEAGFIVMTVLSGMATFMFAYPAAKAGKLRFGSALIDRVLRHWPGVASIMALDFTWYLWGSGPFYSRIGEIHVDKCSRTWWKNFLFVSNLWGPSIDICSGHTFFSSVDIQLFILGFIVIKILVSYPKVGTALGIGMIVFGEGLMYYLASVHELTPTIMVAKDPYILALEEFLFYIHMSTWGAFPSYFFGILMSYSISLGHWRKYAKNVNHIFWLGSFLMMGNIIQYMPILHNTLNILGKAWIPLYIIGVRNLVLVQMALFLIYVSLINDKGDNKVEQKDVAPKKIDEGGGSYSFTKGLVRLSFSIYLSNYYYIRTDFFSERTFFYNTLYALIKRLVSSFVFILITALIFQLVFLGPFTNLRVAALQRKKSSNEKDDKKVK